MKSTRSTLGATPQTRITSCPRACPAELSWVGLGLGLGGRLSTFGERAAIHRSCDSPPCSRRCTQPAPRTKVVRNLGLQQLAFWHQTLDNWLKHLQICAPIPPCRARVISTWADVSEGLFEVGGRGGGGRSCAGRPIRRDVLHGRPRPLLLTDTSAPGKGLTWVHGVSSHH